MTEPARRPDDSSGSAAPVRPPGDPARTLRLVERREHSLLSLIELSHELRVSLDPYGIAELVLFNLMGHFGTPRAAIWLLAEAPHGHAVLVRSHGLHEDVARAIGDGLGPQMIAQWTYEQMPLQVADGVEAGRVPGMELALQSQLAVLAPVPSHGELIGLIAVGTRLSGEPYGPLDLEYVAAAAGMVGAAIENTRLYHRVLEVNRQLQQANQNLLQLDALKAQFVQNVNHELRTPLAVIIGYLENLLESPDLSPTHRKALGVLSEQAEKLTGMVENLLDLSSVADQAMTLELTEGSVAELVTSCAEARKPGVTSGLRELVCEVDPDVPRARFDHKRLSQVISLLLDNAVKFTPHGTRIALRAVALVRDGARCACVQVADNGPGIPPQDVADLLQPFQQGDGSATRRVGGIGIGLSLAREIVEKMGGTLECASEVGEGTTFNILLRS